METIRTCCWNVLDDGPGLVLYDYEVDVRSVQLHSCAGIQRYQGRIGDGDSLGNDFFAHVVELRLSDSAFPEATFDGCWDSVTC